MGEAANNNNLAFLGDSELSGERPVFYGENRLVLHAVDPEIVHAYWEVSLQDRYRLKLGSDSHFVLRVYNVDERTKEEYWFPEEISNCFLAVKNTGATYRAELGIYRKDRYHCLALSNPVRTPNGGIDSTPAQPVQNSQEKATDQSTAPSTSSKENLCRLLNLDETTVQLDLDTEISSGTVANLAGDQWHTSPHG